MSNKPAAFRAQQQSELLAGESKYRAQVGQLQEFFPDFSVEDLQSLLLEVGGDMQLAADRISEGHAEQWGSVKSKKDKKPTPPAHPNPKDHPSSRDRTDSRGTRGGRGGRGGPSRGPRGRGSPRGAPGVNGHTSRPSHPGKTSSPAPDPADKQSVEEISDPPQHDKPDASNGLLSTPHDAPSDPDPHADALSSDPSLPPQSLATPPSWGSSSWGAQDHSTSVPPISTPSLSTAPKSTKLPATSKLSWAQIARPQEKLTVAPLPALPRPPSVPEPSAPVPAPLLNGDSDPTSDGWEDPTTVQPPIWDDDPQVKAPPEDAWSSPVQTQPDVQEDTPAPLPQEEPEPEIPAPVSSQPAPALQPQPLEEPITTPPPSKSLVSVPHRSSAPSHRSSNKYKATDQAVVMPSSGFNPGLDKIGMQFGSLSLGGDMIESSPTEPTPVLEPTSVRAKQSPQQLIQPLPQAQVPVQESPMATTPVRVTSTPPQIPPQQQTALPAPAPPPSSASVPASVPQTQPPITTTITHTSIATSVSQPIMSSSPGFSQQPQTAIHPSLSQHQQQAPLTQHQAPAHQYSHHSLPAHLDATQNPTQQSQHTVQPSQPQGSAAHSAFFRQAEAPYFHTPTPPAGQGQDYSIFGQIGQQHQASHLGAFANNDYGYGDSQRGFYESYAQSPAFGGSRNVLGHDDVKALPTSQQLPGNTILPSNAQSSQLPPQGGAQPQPSGSQGPQQNYPPPLPYYYPYPQNQYYGSPYSSGYGVPQPPFVKYPTVFQPGPPAQGAAPSPASKQGPASVQSQSDHYGRGLYGQQHQLPSSAYDELGYSHHAPQHSHAPGVNSLTSNDYSKHPQLYGGQAIQGFMGLGQGSATASGPSLAQRAGGTSPEAYKPYSQNVGVKDGVSGVGVGQSVGQPQSGRGVQQAHAQGGFYGSNRFGSGAGAGGPQAQQGQQATQGPQGHVGYPQGNSDANFYQYQPRQQQGYWQ